MNRIDNITRSRDWPKMTWNTAIRKYWKNLLTLSLSWIVFIWAIWQSDVLAGGAGTLAPHWNELFAFFMYPGPLQVLMLKGHAWELLLCLIFVAFVLKDLAWVTWEDDKQLSTTTSA